MHRSDASRGRKRTLLSLVLRRHLAVVAVVTAAMNSVLNIIGSGAISGGFFCGVVECAVRSWCTRYAPDLRKCQETVAAASEVRTAQQRFRSECSQRGGAVPNSIKAAQPAALPYPATCCSRHTWLTVTEPIRCGGSCNRLCSSGLSSG